MRPPRIPRILTPACGATTAFAMTVLMGLTLELRAVCYSPYTITTT